MSVDWLLESAPYNEWLNEEDYQLEENGKVCTCTGFEKADLKKNNPVSFKKIIWVRLGRIQCILYIFSRKQYPVSG